MFYYFITLILSPLLIVQGLYIRKTTVKLPEAKGERSGIKGQGDKLNLLIIGDSAAAGVGVDSQKNALSGVLIEQLSTSFQVNWKLVARTGDNSSDVLNVLQTMPKESFDIVVLSIGVNDVTDHTSKIKWQKNLDSIINLLTVKFNSKQVFFSAVPPMHLFPALPKPLSYCLGVRAKLLNKIAIKVTRNHCCVSFVQPNIPFERLYMACDGFHPSKEGYQLLGRFLANKITEQPHLKVKLKAKFEDGNA